MDIHINIGSNSGHREALIERAVAAVRSSFTGADGFASLIGREGRDSYIPTEVRCSDIVETPPWGFDSPNPFLNIGMMIRIDPCAIHGNLTDREAFALGILRKLQAIQTEIDPSPHRDESGGYIDRAIDIDLIAIDDWVIRHPDLILPHPRMHLRDFVLVPLRQLSPSWKHPLLTKIPEELLINVSSILISNSR